MKTVKEFFNIAKVFKQRLFCKHKESSISSCPFTGKTYTVCLKCLKKLKSEITK
jgi:hypothetical protein